MQRFILIIAFVFSIFWILPKNVFATPLLTGYGYQKVFYATGSTAGAVSNYQIKLTLNKGTGHDTSSSFYLDNHVLSSFNDIRFTTSDGTTLLDYWIESSDSNTATVWVELDSVPASPSKTTFYLFYGNSSATSLSNGANTFNFFEDFDTNGISLWTGSDQYKHTGETATQTASSTKSFSSPNSAKLYTYANCNRSPWNGIGSILSQSINIASGTYKVDFNVLRDIIDFRFNTTAIQRSIVNINSVEKFNESTACAGSGCSVVGSWASKSFDVVDSSIDTIDIKGYSDDCTEGNVWFDNLRVRNYISPEPTLSIDESQEEESTPASTSNSISSAPICTDSKPSSFPDLFQINVTNNSAKLFFTPLSDTSQYYISFSEKFNIETHGEQVTLLKEGVQSHNIYFLKPNATYYIKVRGQNGCMPGEWSNTIKFNTNSIQNIFYRYINFTKKIISPFQIF